MSDDPTTKLGASLPQLAAEVANTMSDSDERRVAVEPLVSELERIDREIAKRARRLRLQSLILLSLGIVVFLTLLWPVLTSFPVIGALVFALLGLWQQGRSVAMSTIRLARPSLLYALVEGMLGERVQYVIDGVPPAASSIGWLAVGVLGLEA